MENEHLLHAEKVLRDLAGRNVKFIPSPKIFSRSKEMIGPVRKRPAADDNMMPLIFSALITIAVGSLLFKK